MVRLLTDEEGGERDRVAVESSRKSVPDLMSLGCVIKLLEVYKVGDPPDILILLCPGRASIARVTIP